MNFEGHNLCDISPHSGFGLLIVLSKMGQDIGLFIYSTIIIIRSWFFYHRYKTFEQDILFISLKLIFLTDTLI
jgi:hypothetical protein